MSGVLLALGDVALVVSGAAAGYAFRAWQEAKRAADEAERNLRAALRFRRGNGGLVLAQPSDPDYDEEERR